MAKEFDLLSPVYDEVRVTPVALGVAGEVLSFNALTGELLSDISAAEVGLGETRTLIVSGNLVKVVKTAGQVWAAGQPVYFDPATGACTTTKGILKCVGYAYEAALLAATEGVILLDGKPQAGNGLQMRSGLVSITAPSVIGLDTGLTLIVEAFVTVKATAQGAGDAAYATYDHGADGLIDIYTWDDVGAAAGNDSVVAWMAFGN